jgi:hypothetical protein
LARRSSQAREVKDLIVRHSLQAQYAVQVKCEATTSTNVVNDNRHPGVVQIII